LRDEIQVKGRSGFRAVAAALVLVVPAFTMASPAAAADFGDPARVALETDRIIDQMSAAQAETSLARWTREILPWFAEQGIVTHERAPVRVRYVDFSGPLATLLLGTADCTGAVVSISGRYANPVSSMYRSVDIVLTLTHELAHIQQNALCERAPTGVVETSAQLMAFEVDAAMALDGNTSAGLALLREVRDIAVGMLQFDAERQVPGAQGRLETVCAAIYTSAERARAAQRTRYWERTPVSRKESLLQYAVGPYRKLATAFRGDRIVTGLATPITHPRPWAVGPTSGSLLVDDLAHFLDVAAELYSPRTLMPSWF
jgi:hypothetical protein